MQFRRHCGSDFFSHRQRLANKGDLSVIAVCCEAEHMIIVSRLKSFVLVVGGLVALGAGFSHLDKFEDWLGCHFDQACVVQSVARLGNWAFRSAKTDARSSDDPAVTRAKNACLKIEWRHRIERSSPYSGAQLYLFCDCLGNAIPDLLATVDPKRFGSDGQPSPDLQRRFADATHACEQKLHP
jgi:hypothetical protein